VLNTRCTNNPWFGLPHKVTTVDKYQGQQNDYILLSLVRTRTVGHLRDVRRLIVAMSRARLGLYVFARIPLFSNCYELAPAFKILTGRPPTLQLYPAETFPTERKLEEKIDEVVTVKDMPQMAALVYEMYMQKISALKEEEKVKAEEMASMITEPVGQDKGPVYTPIEFEEGGGEVVGPTKDKQMKMDVDEKVQETTPMETEEAASTGETTTEASETEMETEKPVSAEKSES